MGPRWLAVTRGGAVSIYHGLFCGSSFLSAGWVPINWSCVHLSAASVRELQPSSCFWRDFLLLHKKSKSQPALTVLQFKSSSPHGKKLSREILNLFNWAGSISATEWQRSCFFPSGWDFVSTQMSSLEFGSQIVWLHSVKNMLCLGVTSNHWKTRGRKWKGVLLFQE